MILTDWLRYYFNMSLLIVGSCSRITQNIILSLSKHNLYQSITISDLLPVYDHHRRYYRLRKDLKQLRSATAVSLTKLTSIAQLSQLASSHQDVLYVTHDYFHTVTSKTKLMELTASLAKNNRRLLFATPIEYDHYGFANPEQHYLQAEGKVREIAPKASFLRSDVQDGTELYAYLNKSKTIWEEKLLTVPHSFQPRVVNSLFYAQQVATALKEGWTGEVTTIRGEKEKDLLSVNYNKEIENYQTDHLIGNIRLLVTKYRGPEDKSSRLVQSK